MSVESSEHCATWDSVEGALGEIRDAHAESREFFSGVFDQLDVMLTELAGRKRQWDSQRSQAEIAVAREADQLRQDHAALDARENRFREETATAAQSGELLQQLLSSVQRWEQIEARREEAAGPPPDEGLRERLEQLQQQQASLEQERTALESELEAVHRRAAEMAELLAEHKQQAASQRVEFAEELKRMRRLLEAISCRLIEGNLAGGDPPTDTHVAPSGAAPKEADGDAVLESVAAQFEMLQKDLARRRAARSEQRVS